MINTVSIRVLLHSFLYHKRYLILIFVVSMLSMLSFSTYLILNETNNYEDIQNIMNTYGKYAYRFSNLEYEEVKILQEDKHTVQFSLFTSSYVELNNETFSVLTVNNEFFEYSNYEIIEGYFPKNSDEILVPKWYLFQLGIKNEDMVGAKIKIKNPETQQMEFKTVSGLVICHNDTFSLDNVDTSGFIIFNSKYVEFQNSTYNILILSDHLGKAEQNAINLTKILHKNNANSSADYMLNYPLLQENGSTEQGKIMKRNQQLVYHIIICILLVFTSVVFRNILVICLFKWKNVITTYKLLGINMKKVVILIGILFSGLTLIGNLIGVTLSIILVKILAKFSIYIVGLKISSEIVIPYLYLVEMTIFTMFLVLLLLYRNTRKWGNITAGSMLQEQNFAMLNKHLSKASLFKNQKYGCVKIAFRNIFCHHSSKTYLSFCIATCIFLIFVINVQIIQNINTKDNNQSYSYYVEVKDYYNLINVSKNEVDSLKIVYEQIKNICSNSGYKVYYDAQFVTRINYPKKNLATNFVNDLKKTASGYVKLLNQSDTIDMNLVIMGYSNEMIEEMAKQNNCALPYLHKKEAIMLSRTVDKDGTGSLDICPSFDDIFNIETLKFSKSTQQWYKQSYAIVSSVPNLCVYPSFNENSLCMLINIDEYNTWFNNDFVSSFYLKELDDSTMSKIQELLKGNTSIKLINQKDVYTKQKTAYQKKMLILYILLIFSCLFTVINIQLQSIFEFDSRIYEFNLLLLLGMSKFKRNLMIIIESSFIFIIGIAIGFFISKLMMLYSYETGLIHTASFHVRFVIIPIAIIILFMILSAYLACKRYTVVLRDMEY